MLKNYIYLILFAFIFFYFSCSSDDSNNTYVPLEVETNPDTVQVTQNIATIILVFNNDVNIPNQGSLTVSVAQNGVVVVSDPNNTTQNPSMML